jgi:hypothetical protein
VGFLLKDERAPIDGRNAETSWWYIQRQDGPGHCWVANYLTAEEGDIASVPVVQAPPTPTPVDIDLPIVTISHSPLGTWKPDEDDIVTFLATASDDRGVAKIEIWVQSPGTSQMSKVKTCQSSVSCTFQGGPYAPGVLSYTAKAWDQADNLGESTPVLITVHSVLK